MKISLGIYDGTNNIISVTMDCDLDISKARNLALEILNTVYANIPSMPVPSFANSQMAEQHLLRQGGTDLTELIDKLGLKYVDTFTMEDMDDLRNKHRPEQPKPVGTPRTGSVVSNEVSWGKIHQQE